MATLKEDGLVIAGVAVAALVVLWYVKNKAGDVAKAVVPMIDPTDTNNLAYTSTNSLLGLMMGERNFDLGTGLYDATGGNLGKVGEWIPTPLKIIEATQAGAMIGAKFGKETTEAIMDWWAK